MSNVITVHGTYGNHSNTTTIRCKNNGVYLYTTRRSYKAALSRLNGPVGDYLVVEGNGKGQVNVLGYNGRDCWTVM